MSKLGAPKQPDLISIRDQEIRSQGAQGRSFATRFDELEADIADKARVRPFTELCSVAQSAADAAEPIEYTHRNEHYAVGHVWARLLLAQQGIHDLYRYSTGQAFLLDINVLFERFIARVLEDSARVR